MEIRLDRIQEERFELSEVLTVPVEDLDETDLVALSGIRVNGRVERTSHTSFLLTATLEYRQTLACVRCLREIEDDFSTELQLLITVDKPSSRGPARPVERTEKPARAKEARGGGQDEADGGEQELAEADLNTVSLSEPVLDTLPIVIEQIHLGIPMKPLCRESCQGLCGQCGGDLNEGPCGCAPAGDARLAKLAILRGKLGDDN